jgi:DNA-directed RNA polymerase specialized sigma24 family protein
MSAEESVTVWIARLKAGDPVAAERLWEGYFRRLVGLARRKLQGRPRAAADEEDVALSAFDSFCRGAERDRFPRLADRDDLWQLLVLLTARKALRRIRYEQAAKRDCRRTRHAPAPEEDRGGGLAEVIGREPTPEFAAQVAEEYRQLLDGLDEELRTVAVAKMEGHSNAEIAARAKVTERTVERRLVVIRKLWKEKDQP